MSETILISTRVSVDLAERLADLSQTTHRPGPFWRLRRFEEFLNIQEWLVEAIKEGLAAADRGDLKSHEQAIAILSTWGKSAKT